MALIGTISGSNGTTTSAVSGSLIIANQPPGSFPSLPAGVNLYVSGARGVDVDSASALFGGDVFMSGALGLQEYLQLRPISNKRFPTATTASYIYTSGSTNDLYFTQFSGSYQNDVRLRWLEGTLTTGLLNGGIVSTVAGTTTFSVTAGTGIIVSQNAAISSEPYPTIEYVTWPAVVSASLLYSGSAQITYVSIESGGTTAQSNTPPTLAQYKDRIFLGRVLHQTGSVSNGAINSPAMAYAVSTNTFDFIRPFGPLKVSGHVLTTSGSTLGLLKTAGDSYSEGRNYSTDPSAPNTILAAADPALTDCKIFRQYVSGSTIIQDTGIGNAGYAVIDPSKYNNDGTLEAVGNSEWTNQRVFWFPKSVNRALLVYYGNAKYNTLLEATAGLITESFVEGDNTKGAAIYIGAVSVKGNETNLTDTVNARLTQAGLFRGAGTGGGSSGGSTSPGGSTTQVQFNDGGAFGGDPNFTFNNITHALSVTGDITGSNLRLTGDIAVVGGDLTTSVSTFNLVTGSATTVNFAQSATTVAIGAPGGRTTVAHDLAVGTGNIIGAPGTGANVMTLLSSGNIVAKLDVDNSAVGHKFIVQDYTGASQFSVGENGNAELTGSLVVTGSVTALAGFSGSLTKLSDGSDYLLPGNNVSLSTGSSGAITIGSVFLTEFFTQAFGSGLDGNLTVLDGVTFTLTPSRDFQYNNITIQGSGSIKPAGSRIFCKGTLTISASGSINDDGDPGSGSGLAGAALGQRGFLCGAAGGGAAGRVTLGIGAAALGVAGMPLNDNGVAPAGGAGGAGAGPQAGGAATVGTLAFASQTVHSCWQHGRPIFGAVAAGNASGAFGTGVGGSAGGNGGGGGVWSGGGGAGGGIVWLCAKTIVNAGRISANGGVGGAAVGGNNGGGGGGSGGIVIIITTTPAATIGGTITANGGGGGAPTGTGTSGGPGTVGSKFIISYG